jgi:hypothetical protein
MVSNIALKSHGTGCGETRRAAQWISVLLPVLEFSRFFEVFPKKRLGKRLFLGWTGGSRKSGRQINRTGPSEGARVLSGLLRANL